VNSKLIVALDVPERDRTLALARSLVSEVAMLKIGLEGFVAHGPELVRAVVGEGASVFLDLKLHDIPRTAAAAARAAAGLGVSLLTVHAAGGAEMVRAVRDELPATTKVIAVTMLTSLDAAAAAAIGYSGSVADAARRLGALALASGADGLVTSSHELAALRDLGGLRVVPGIRPSGAGVGDQKRVATPAEAVRAGASYLVVGRPILEAPDPAAAARAVNREVASA